MHHSTRPRCRARLVVAPQLVHQHGSPLLIAGAFLGSTAVALVPLGHVDSRVVRSAYALEGPEERNVCVDITTALAFACPRWRRSLYAYIFGIFGTLGVSHVIVPSLGRPYSPLYCMLSFRVAQPTMYITPTSHFEHGVQSPLGGGFVSWLIHSCLKVCRNSQKRFER